MLGCKNPGGFLFAMFDVIMPILEQLQYGDFVIFSAWYICQKICNGLLPGVAHTAC